jgi:4-amino-4-deoxy-L-arabinose transferase-like glycosyltransferase
MTEEEGTPGEEWITTAFVAAAGLALLFNLWSRSLENHGYLRYAEIAREMIRSGDWIVPRLNGEIYIDKPPLLFWLIALPSHLYGSVTPFLARLPSALAAWVGVVVVCFWGRRVYRSGRAGVVAGAILLVSYQYFFQARTAKTDMLLCLWSTLSLFFFFLGDESRGGRRFLWTGLSFFAMGLGVLTKGPFGLFVPLAVIAAYLAKEWRPGRLLSREFLLGYIIFALTVLPWALLFVERVGLDRVLTLLRENKILSRHGPVYFYVGQIWVQFFPGALLLPVVGLSLWKEGRRVWASERSFFLLWAAVLLVALTLFKFRVSRYFLPVLPALALLAAGVAVKRAGLVLRGCLLVVLLWHGVELYWLRGDVAQSPGRALAAELGPFVRDTALTGFWLESDTVEELNFYLDRLIPHVKRKKGLRPAPPGGGLVLMPRKIYDELALREGERFTVKREFRYNETRLVLVSSEINPASGPPSERR